MKTKYSQADKTDKALPYVIFHCEYNQNIYGDNLSKDMQERKMRNDFFRCKNTDNDVVKYLLRKNSGIDKATLDNAQRISELMQKSKISETDIVSYAANRPGSSGAFNLDGDITTNQLSKIKKDLSTTKSIIWDGVISFSEDYGKNNCPTKVEAYEMLKKVMPQFFKDAGMDPKNMNTMFAMHHNTDNLHIHFLFWEKEPQLINAKGKLVFHPGTIPHLGHITDVTRLNILNHFGINNQERYDAFNKLKAEFYHNLVHGKYAKEVSTLHKVLKNNKLKQFSRISKYRKQAIKGFYNFLIQNDPEIKSYYNDFKNILYKEQAQFVSHYQNLRNRDNNHIFLNLKNVNMFARNRLNDLEVRMCNLILKEVPKLNIQKQPFFNDDLKINKMIKTHMTEKRYIANGKAIDIKNKTLMNRFYNKYKDGFLKHIAQIEQEIQNYKYQFSEDISYEDYKESKFFKEG